MAACSILHYYGFNIFEGQTRKQVSFGLTLPKLTFFHFQSLPRFKNSRVSLPLLSSLSPTSITEENVESRNGDLEFVEVGYVSDVHGLDGEIRVKHNTDFPELRFSQPGERWLRQQVSGREDVFEVELLYGRGHPGSKSWIVKLNGFDSVDKARQLVGSTFLVRNIDRPDLEEGEYYSRDLVGMRVILKDTGEALGSVINVFNSGGNDLLQVLLESSNGPPGGGLKSEKTVALRRVWIPFVEAIVPHVDMDTRELWITPPKGLLDLNNRSNETSKKERRLIEWRERKKFQRRLISAKKKLCELEQQHIFHGFRFGEKAQTRLLSEHIISVSSNLLQQALQAIENPMNGSNLGEVWPDVTSSKCDNILKISESWLTSAIKEKHDTYSEFCRTGVRLISEGKFARVLVLNRSPEFYFESNNLDIDSDKRTTISYVENLLLDEQTFIQAEDRESIPFILILPVEEIEPLEKLLASNDYFGFSPSKVRLLPEEKLPVVSNLAIEQKKNKVLMKSPWEIHQSSIGFGGTLSALSSNNVMDDLIQSGVEYIEVCNINNQRSVCGNPIILGFLSSQETDIGILKCKANIESEDDLHVILPMKSLQKMVKLIEKLPLQPAVKSYKHVELINKEWVDVIPSTPNAYEFGCSLQSLLRACSLEKASLVEIDS